MNNHIAARTTAGGRWAVPALTALALTAGALGAVTAPAGAYTSVPGTGADAWGVHDAAIPGLDTGSVMDTKASALQGYGGIRVQVAGGTSPLNGILLRGFGLTHDGRGTFDTTQGVTIDGVVVQREVRTVPGSSSGRFFDSFTNTTSSPVTVEVAFGGQLGYNTGVNQSAIATTSSGDTAITDADGWASWYTPSSGAGSASRNGPSATVFGTPGDSGLERVGTFLRDPFSNDLPATGDEANHPAFMHEVLLQPGETGSLAHFVVTGLSETNALGGGAVPAAGSQVTDVQSRAQALTSAPDFTGLSSGEICSVVNFDTGLAPEDCATAAFEPIQGGVTGAVQAETVRTTSPYDVIGKTMTQLIADMESGVTNAQQITRAYLDRIAAYDRGPYGLKSVIAVAPDAMKQARTADRARKAGDKRPLLGIPILAKDIIDTFDMPTTGGSLVFDGYTPKDDSFQVKKLREAGAIILGKTNLAEFANDGHYSPSAFGQVWNAFDPSRSSIGSSGGSAVAVASSMGAAAFGTQTGDSLWGPAGAASLYSLRGTDGMQSSAGTMPLTIITDYVGFLTQSLDDLALLLEATAVDNPDDVLDDVANGHRPEDWTEFFSTDALRGKVIGVPAQAFDDPFGTTVVSDALRAQFSVFEQAGATVKEIPAAPSGPVSTPGDKGYEGWAQWIEAHPDNPYAAAEQIIRNALRIPTRRNTTPYTGTGRMTDAELRGFEKARADYRDRIGTWMDDNGVDAVLYPTELSDIHLNDSISPSFGRRDPQSSAAGVPTVIFPAGLNAHDQPVGFQLQGKEFQDAELMGFAYAFDQIAQGRVLPAITPALEYDADAIPTPVEPLEPAPLPTPLPTPAPTPTPTPGAPVDKRLTALGTSVKVGKQALKAPLALGCASASGACTGNVQVFFKGDRIASKKVQVTAGGKRTVKVALPRAVRRKLMAGGKVVVKVAFVGTGTTGSQQRKVRITLRR